MTDNFERFRPFMQLPEEEAGRQVPEIKKKHLTLLFEDL